MTPSSKNLPLKFLFAALSLFSLTACKPEYSLRKVIATSENQVKTMLEEIHKENLSTDTNDLVSPRTIDENGNLVLVKSNDWTSGFFPGILWYLYELTGKEEWWNFAQDFTNKIEDEKYNAKTHDMGFKIYCSFGNDFRLTGDKNCRDVIIQSAMTLSKRFNPKIGCIRSWDHNKDKWQYPVIIDNIMNLELLFAASRFSGDPSFREIAIQHANTTIKNHFRKDYSTYHVIDYDTLTGEVLKKNTHQGYSDESTWARGEAWALYGFTMCYRETGDISYLEQAENIASFILNHPNLPEDLIPYWDFNAPAIPDEPRDASAASVISSSLFELSTYSEQNRKLYRDKANLILRNLSLYYMAKKGEAEGFILKHSVGSFPSNKEVDVPLVYSDYYFLEALLRSRRLKTGMAVV